MKPVLLLLLPRCPTIQSNCNNIGLSFFLSDCAHQGDHHQELLTWLQGWTTSTSAVSGA
jgi:hypothetical protein